MDLALALVEEDHGSRLALQVARNLVLYLRRPGGQSQFSAALSLQLTDRKPLRELEAWVLDNLHKPLTVPLLAQRVAMSPRNFARVFTKEMKTTPAKFVERLRVEAARRRLEESQNSMEMIADECGFGNVNSMRNVFQRTLKIAPGQYRRHFRHVKHRAKGKNQEITRSSESTARFRCIQQTDARLPISSQTFSRNFILVCRLASLLRRLRHTFGQQKFRRCRRSRCSHRVWNCCFRLSRGLQLAALFRSRFLFGGSIPN